MFAKENVLRGTRVLLRFPVAPRSAFSQLAANLLSSAPGNVWIATRRKLPWQSQHYKSEDFTLLDVEITKITVNQEMTALFFLQSSAFPDTSGYCSDGVSCWNSLRIYDIHEIRRSVCHKKMLRSLSLDYWRGTGTQTLRAFLIACQKLPKSSKHFSWNNHRHKSTTWRFKHNFSEKSWQCGHGKHENMQGAQCHNGMHLLCIGTASLLWHNFVLWHPLVFLAFWVLLDLQFPHCHHVNSPRQPAMLSDSRTWSWKPPHEPQSDAVSTSRVGEWT